MYKSCLIFYHLLNKTIINIFILLFTQIAIFIALFNNIIRICSYLILQIKFYTHGNCIQFQYI